jgi:hypothetical protein
LIQIEPGTLSAVDAEEAAYKASLTTGVTDQTNFLLATIGPRVAAASIGLADARQLKKWTTFEQAPKSAVVAERLRVVFRVTYAITAMYSGSTAASFLRSSNPQLDDQSPMMLLREQPVEDVEAQILAATRALLEG